MTAASFPSGNSLGDSTISNVDARSTSSAVRPSTGDGGSLFPFTGLFIDVTFVDRPLFETRSRVRGHEDGVRLTQIRKWLLELKCGDGKKGSLRNIATFD